MAEDRTVVREIVWTDIFPSALLLSVWRLAINLRVLTLAAAGVLITWLGWRWFEGMFHIVRSESLSAALWDSSADVPPDLGDWLLFSPLVGAWRELSQPFVLAFHPVFSVGQFWYLVLCALWGLAIWAIAGGAICRICAVELARQEKLSLGQAVNFARQKWPSLVAAPLYPMFGVLLATIPLALLGLISRLDGVGITILGLFWPLVLLAAVAMTVLLLGLFFNWPLMWPTIASEGTDSFDALSRSYAYTFQRPLRYFGYVVMAAVIGLLAGLIVHLFGQTVLWLAQWSVSWGSGVRIEEFLLDPDRLQGAARFGARLMQFWNAAVGLFVNAFGFGYFFAAATAIYLLQRFHVDAVETDEVYLPDEGQLYGMPPLEADSAGVPKVADAAPVASSPEG